MGNKIAKKRINNKNYVEGSLVALDVTEELAIEIVNKKINKERTISLLSDTGDTWTVEIREYISNLLETTSLIGIFKVNKKTGNVYMYNHTGIIQQDF